MPQLNLNWPPAEGADQWTATTTDAETVEFVPQYFVVAVDLGSVNDATAIAVLEVFERTVTTYKPGRFEPIRVKSEREQQFLLRLLHRPRLGTGYDKIVQQVGSIVQDLPYRLRKPFVVFDQTGLGGPVVDFARRAGIRCTGIVITSGQNASLVSDSWTVPKALLVGELRMAMHRNQLKIAQGFAERDRLAEELSNFTAKLTATGRATFESPGDAADDTVLALSMAVFVAKSRPQDVRIQRLGY